MGRIHAAGPGGNAEAMKSSIDPDMNLEMAIISLEDLMLNRSYISAHEYSPVLFNLADRENPYTGLISDGKCWIWLKRQWFRRNMLAVMGRQYIAKAVREFS
jgi:hypothetical protein